MTKIDLLRRSLTPLLLSAILLSGAARLDSRAASSASSRPETSMNQAQIDLAWFMAGLRDLAKSKNSKLKLNPAQAKKILPELQALKADKIIVTEVPEIGQGGNRGQSMPQPGQGNNGTRQFSEQDRQKMQTERQKQADRIEKSIQKMESALRQTQSDYIINLDFDPAYYGLNQDRSFFGGAGPQGTGSGATQARPSQAEIQKTMKQRQEAMKRLVQLNNETLSLLTKLAK